MNSVLKYWRAIIITLLTVVLFFLSRTPGFWVFAPAYFLLVAITGLRVHETKYFTYLLGSISIPPIGFLFWFIVLMLARSSSLSALNSPVDSSGVISVCWWIIWFCYAFGLRKYFTDWIHPGTRWLSMGMLSISAAYMAYATWLSWFCSFIYEKGKGGFLERIPFCQAKGLYMSGHGYERMDSFFITAVFIPALIVLLVPLLFWVYEAMKSYFNKKIDR